MPKKAPQFFRDKSPETKTGRAIYKLPRTDGNGQPILVAVEVVEGGGNVPRNATSFRSIAKEIDMAKELDSIAAVAETVFNSLKAISPGAMEIEFGVELGGEMGIPLVSKGEAKANFKVTLKWGKDKE